MFSRWPLAAWVLLGATLLGGCQPRPQFKVRATEIGSGVTTLLARLWLAEPDLSVHLAGGLAVPESGILESVPTNATATIAVPSCAPGDEMCALGIREYSFGIDFPPESSLSGNGVALLGLAAVGAPTATAPGGCLLGLTSGQTVLSQSYPPSTMTVSLLKWAQSSTKCLTRGELPLIAAVSLEHTVAEDGNELDIVTIDGWNFGRDLVVTVDSDCGMTTLSYATQDNSTLKSAATSKILSVSPSRIVTQLAMINRVSTACKQANARSILVTVNLPGGGMAKSDLFILK